MKVWKLSLLAMAIALAGCDDSDTIVIGPTPDPDPEPVPCDEGYERDESGQCVLIPEPEPEPEPEITVPANEATTMVVSVGTVPAETGVIEFTLATDAGEPISGLSNINVTYMGYPDADEQAKISNSIFKLAWHQTLQIDCSGSCDGTLDELEAGSYRFTPTPSKYQWHEDITTGKYQFTVAGTQAGDTVDLTPMEATAE